MLDEMTHLTIYDENLVSVRDLRLGTWFICAGKVHIYIGVDTDDYAKVRIFKAVILIDGHQEGDRESTIATFSGHEEVRIMKFVRIIYA